MRKYVPWQGRWTRRDSTFEHGGYNLYSINHNAMFSWFDFLGKAPQYIYPGVTAVYDPATGQGEIITSHDVDFGGRLPPADYNIGLSTSFGVTISFLFGNHEFVNEDGCSFYCIGLTTQPAGVSGGVSIGNGSMVSGSIGMGWKLGGGSLGSLDAGMGFSMLPAQGNIRLICLSLNEENDDGCPCEGKAPSSLLGQGN